MSTVILQRGFQNSKVTLGMLQLVGIEHAPVYTLENPFRVGGVDSCIPAGTYTCVPYSGTKYKNVFLVKDVPGRSAILIHTGNTEKDTLGCILVGLSLGWGTEASVLESKKGLEYFKSLVSNSEFTLVIKE